MHYGVLITVTSADTRNDLSNLLTGLRGYAIARWYPGSNVTGPADYYVLGIGLDVAAIAGTDPKTGQPLEIPIGFWLSYNPDLSSSVTGLIANIQPYAKGGFYPTTVKTRAELVAGITNEAVSHGCDHLWTVKPGDDVTTGVTINAELMAKFTPVT